MKRFVMPLRLLSFKVLATAAATLIAFSSSSYAKVTCTEPDFSALATTFTNPAVAKSWVPDTFSFDKNSVDYYGARVNRAESETKFKFFVEGKQISGSYSAARNRLKFQLSADPGFKIHAPAYYRTCTVSTSGSSNKSTVSGEKRAFKAARSCERRFIQSYLKSAGLYNSSIDGRWGNGTANALRNAKKITRFRNMTEQKILNHLVKEAPC